MNELKAKCILDEGETCILGTEVEGPTCNRCGNDLGSDYVVLKIKHSWKTRKQVRALCAECRARFNNFWYGANWDRVEIKCH